MIFYILGMASGFEALFLLLPILVSLIYGESVLSSYLISCGICALFCGVSTLRKPKKITLYTTDFTDYTDLFFFALKRSV